MNKISFVHLRRAPSGNESTLLLDIHSLNARIETRPILHDLNLTINKGDWILVKGGNGAGKTSLLNAIAGLEPVTVQSGSIRFNGQDITNLRPHKRAQIGIAYLRQRENVFPDLTVQQNLSVALGPKGSIRFAEEFPEWAKQIPLGKHASLLSGGERQRVAWAMVALRPNRLLLADEPETGLSVPLHLPSQQTVILVSHNHTNWETSSI